MEEKAKEHAERMLALVEASGWREWLNETVVPLLQDIKSALLLKEDLSETERIGKITTLKVLKRVVSQPYTDAGMSVPVVIDRMLT